MPEVIIGGIPVQVDDYGNPLDPTMVAPDSGALAGDVVSAPYVPPPPTVEEQAAARGWNMQLNGQVGPSEMATKVGNKTGVAVSETAMSDKQLTKNRQGYGEVMKGEAAIGAQEQARVAPEADAFAQVNAQGEAAVAAEAEAAAKQFDAKAEGDRALADLSTRFATASQEAQNVAAARAQEYRSKVEQSLAEYRAADVQPGKLWKDMGEFGRGGMLISAFVTDFLGAKGIKTSAMDIFNRAVEQNINAQVENIRKKGQVAEHFKSLWDMSMREGASEQEARQVIHAHMLASAEKQISATIGQYDSDLARARGAKQISALRSDLTARLADIQDKVYARTQQRLQMKLDNEYKSQQLAVQRRSLKLQEDQLKEQQDARKAAAKGVLAKDLNELVITDPDSGQIVKKARTTKDAEDVRLRLAGKAQLIDSVAETRDLLKEAGEIYGGWGAAMANAGFKQRAEAARNRTLAGYTKMVSGAAFSEAEMKRYEKIIPIDTWTTEPPTDAIYSDMVRDAGSTMQKEIQARTSDLTAMDQEIIASGAVMGSDPSTYQFADAKRTEAEMLASGAKRETTRVDEVAKKVNDADNEAVHNPPDDLAESWKAAGLGKQQGKWVYPPPTEQAAGVLDVYELAVDPQATTAEREGAYQLLLTYSAEQDGSDRATMARHFLPQVNEYRSAAANDPWASAVTR